MPRLCLQVAGGTTVMRINSRQLFHIEPLGEKKVRCMELFAACASQTDAPRSPHSPRTQPDDPDGAWEEKYNSHTDSKARAPLQ